MLVGHKSIIERYGAMHNFSVVLVSSFVINVLNLIAHKNCAVRYQWVEISSGDVSINISVIVMACIILFSQYKLVCNSHVLFYVRV